MSLDSFVKELPRFKGAFIAGEWSEADSPSQSFEVKSPANHEWVLPDVLYSYTQVDKAVGAATEALPQWKHLDLDQRIEKINRFKEELGKRKEHIAELVALETGKPYQEALGEAGALVSKIEVTIDHALSLVQTQRLDLGKAGKGEIHFKPKGVLAVIGPFNFPVHLSNGHLIPALLMGNVCILKPSGKTPYCAQAYFEAVEAAEFPPGVFQMLQGHGDLATGLVRHVGVDGVLATCSFEVGCKIRKALAHSPQKIVALEMGGKNAAIVDEDIEDLDRLAEDLIRSSFLTTGQRCTALSRVYVNHKKLDEIIRLFHEKAKKLVISHPFDKDPVPFMGPLIGEESVERLLKYHGIAKSEGAETVMRPKALEKALLTNKVLPKGNYVSPSIHRLERWNAQSAYQSHEIFAPDIFFCPIESVDEGIDAVNSSHYGLSFSYFGNELKKYEYVADRVNVGLAYFNRPTVGASGRLPFGGWGKSGNHRPAGLFAIYSSTQVQARIL